MSEAGFVLVVDDEPGIRGLIRAVLQEAGYEVREAASGHEALALAGAEAPRAAVLDYMMPGLSGIDTGVELRRLHGGELPLVFISAVRMPIAELQRVDAYLLLNKPFQVDDLVEAVAGAVGVRQPQPLSERADAEAPGADGALQLN